MILHIKREFGALLGMLIVLLSSGNGADGFYYLDKKILEDRLIVFMKDGPTLLANYPMSSIQDESKTESGMLIDYGVKITKESLIEDLSMALKRGNYYELVMMAASLSYSTKEGELKEAAIAWLTLKIGENKYQNVILALCVKICVSKNYLEKDGELLKSRLEGIYEFVKKIRSNGMDFKGYGYVLDIDDSILDDCISEILR